MFNNPPLRMTLSACLFGAASLVLSSNALAQTTTGAAAATKPAGAAPATKPAGSAPVAKPAGATAAAKPASGARAAARPAARKAATAKPAVAAEVPLAAATPEQIDAAERIYYGISDCEFKQSLDVSINPKYPAYADVKFDKKVYTMKPVLSSTGAMRLEDVKNQAVLIQISQKSMLLNTVSGQRLVDECVHPKQRELMELQRQKAAAEAQAASVAAAASAAGVTVPAVSTSGDAK